MIRKLSVLGGAILLWGFFALVAVPALIRSAYAGESIGLLNGIIGGQATTSIDEYLGLWRSVAERITISLLVLGALASFLYPVRTRVARRLRLVAAALPAGRAGALFFALFAGCIAGTTEALIALTRYLVFHLPTGSVTRLEVVWLASAAATVVFAVAALALVAIDRITHADGAVIGVLPFALISLTVFSAVERMSSGLHDVAIALLAASVGIQSARVLADHPAPSRRYVRRSAIVMASLLSIFAVLVPLGRQLNERLAIARLPVAPDAPNVLLIVWDAVRAPSLSAWGYTRETTPELARMAAGGILFENAIAPAPWTAPTHASLFTGHYPIDLSIGFRSPLDDTEPTLAEVLADHGYATAGFVGNRFYAGSGFGLGRGFQSYDDRVDIHAATMFATWWLSERTIGEAMRVLGDGSSRNRRRARTIIDKYLAWRKRYEDRPSFAFLNLFDAHDPYIPPDGWGRVFSDRPLRHSLDGDRIVYTDRELDELRTSYDSCIRYLDSELGRLLEILRADGSLENTLVILTADHGEEFGEHGHDLTTHGKSLYLPSLHVPLVMLYPALGSGERRQDWVSLTDVPATILDVAGLGDDLLPGESLVAADSGTRPAGIFSMVDRYLEARLWPDWPGSAGDMYSVIQDSKHYIRDARGGEFLYDVSEDPWEQNNIVKAAGMEEALTRLRLTLDAFVDSASAKPSGSGGSE